MVTQSPFFKDLQAKVDKGELLSTKYIKISGVWFYKERVLLDPYASLCTNIFHDHHEAPGGGHSGCHRTLLRIMLSFWWLGMKNFIRQAIRECDVCQRNKDETIAPPRLLNLLPLLEGV